MSDDNMELELPEPSPFNTEMKFVSGGDRNVFTKTPANVTRDHFEGPGLQKPVSRAGKGVAKKRKLGIESATPTSSRLNGKGTPGSGANKTTIGTLTVRPKQKRTFRGKGAAARAIPKTYDECEEADKMLIAWRDEKKEWGLIKAEWKRLTGEATAQSTLPNRYARLKTNFAILNEEDNAILLQAKREIEDSFQAQKWTLVADVLKSKGGSDYSGRPIILQRQWKKLMVQGGAVMPAGIVDKDFHMPELCGDDARDGMDED